jgi:hypothetical protein
MKCGKAAGVDNVTVDEISAAGTAGIDTVYKLFKKIWEKEEIPKDWSRAIIVPIFKKKDKTVCDNYRGISLLCHAEKLFASIILQRIRKRTDEILTESQAGFRKSRSTINQLFHYVSLQRNMQNSRNTFMLAMLIIRRHSTAYGEMDYGMSCIILDMKRK